LRTVLDLPAFWSLLDRKFANSKQLVQTNKYDSILTPVGGHRVGQYVFPQEEYMNITKN